LGWDQFCSSRTWLSQYRIENKVLWQCSWHSISLHLTKWLSKLIQLMILCSFRMWDFAINLSGYCYPIQRVDKIEKQLETLRGKQYHTHQHFIRSISSWKCFLKRKKYHAWMWYYIWRRFSESNSCFSSLLGIKTFSNWMLQKYHTCFSTKNSSKFQQFST
jgi:hypothetical protein